MKSIRFTLVLLSLAALSFACPALATSWSNDQSDLWWNSTENGWGIQFVQRGSTIFATMFVYDAAGNPTFYVATMEGTKANGLLTFTGDLFTTHGSWFGMVPYNPAAFGGAIVGNMTWVKSSGEPGTLTYSVNGVNVTKTLVRQPIRNDDYTGMYTVGVHFVVTACTDPTKNGTFDGAATMPVAQNGAAITVTLVESSPTGSAPASISAMRLAASRMVCSGLNRRTSRVIMSLTFIDLPPLLRPAGNVSAAAQPTAKPRHEAAPITV
jgi:hypothetical protein